MTETAIWLAADSMLNIHGDKAAMEAAMIAEAMLVRKDSDSYEAWRSITSAIRELDGARSGCSDESFRTRLFHH